MSSAIMGSLFNNSFLTNTTSTFVPPFLSNTTYTLPKLPTGLTTAFVIIASLLVLEQIVYRHRKGALPGLKWTIPIIGKLADSVSPTLEMYQRQWDMGPLSAISVFHIFIVMASTNEYTRKIFNSPSYAVPCLVASAPRILEYDNWVFLTGKVHADYRRSLNVLFTRKALGVYLGIQDALARSYFDTWLKKAATSTEPMELMLPARNLNMETSLRVFCGPHIPQPAVQEISDKYWLITKALELVNFPIPLPGTNVYNAIQARKIATRWLEDAARKSKIAMNEGKEVECMMDAWVMDMKAAQAAGVKGKIDFSDKEMGQVVLSFLFAAQDAMSSGLIYLFQHLADHPEILAKVRTEQERVRQGDYASPMTLEMLDEMPYLKAVIKESLRLKPPVLMVPYKTTRPFPISPTYTVPAGSMVIPSVYPSLHDPEVYPSPKEFLPNRWLDPNSSANQNPKNYLIFGSGPHKCLGIEYALMHMACVLGTASVLMDWEHVRTAESEKVLVMATIFPKDGCLLKFRPRTG